MCICTLFPVYSSKVDLQLPPNPSARRFLSSLSDHCLQCIMRVSNQLVVLQRYGTRAMQREEDAYYHRPVDTDRGALALAMTREQRMTENKNLSRHLVPIMGQHGWQLSEDGLTWSCRPSPEEAG
jgi:hypothetical protein